MTRRGFLGTLVVAPFAVMAGFKLGLHGVPTAVPLAKNGGMLRAEDWNAMATAVRELQQRVG